MNTHENIPSSVFADLSAIASGISICSTVPGMGYGLLNGGSMASPHVAAVAALLIVQGQACGDNLIAQCPNPVAGWGMVGISAAYPDSVIKKNGITQYRKKNGENIGTLERASNRRRVFENHAEPDKSTQFPYAPDAAPSLRGRNGPPPIIWGVPDVAD